MDEDGIYSIQRDLENQFDDAEDMSAANAGLDRTAPPRIEWFHGQMAREEASRMLGAKPPGTFLVRESITHVGDYIISFRVESGVKHFKVIAHELGDFFVADLCFSSLDDVVDNFYRFPLSDGRVLEFPLHPFNTTQLRAVERTAIATKRHQAQSPEELCFLQGDRLKVLQADDPVWYFCEHETSKQQGWVPAQLLHDLPSGALEKEAISRCQLPPRMQRKHWLHGRISSQDAKAILTKHKPGAFLIRESSSTPGDFTLSFLSGDKMVEHFRIGVADFMDYQLGGRHFGCLEDIVLHYTEKPLTKDLTLKYPVPPERGYGEFDVEGAEYSDPDSQRGPPKPVSRKDTERVQGATAAKQQHTEGDGTYGMSGFLTRKLNKSNKWKRMFFALEPAKRYLHVFDSQTAVKPKHIFDLSSTSLYSLDDSYHGRPYCFQLVLSSSCVDICCDSDEERLSWMQALYRYCYACSVVLAKPSPAAVNRITNLRVVVREVKGPIKGSQMQCQLLFNHVKQARTFLRQVKDKACYFGDEFFFPNLSDIVTSLQLEAYEKKKTKVPICQMNVNIADLPKNAKRDNWVEVGNGFSVRLELHLQDEIQLPAGEYVPLKKFFITQATDILPFLSDIFKLKFKDMAKHLVRLWEQNNVAAERLTSLAELVINSEESVGTLFRGNTLASKCMDQYMKLVAMPFLQSCIEEPIKELFESKASFELDPSRGGKDDNLKPLEYFLKRISACTFKKADQCPGKLALVLHNIRKAATTKFPDSPLVAFTCVSAFAFLRLICPAIINPKLFNMMPDFPCERTARNLTLVAKVMQNLANMTEFGVKEPFMQPCNRFIIAHRGKMQEFLTQLTTMTSNATPAIPDTEASDLASLLQLCLERKDEIVAQAEQSDVPSVRSLPRLS
ncbi:hypothetical protein PTSG_00450 [Salpingoeca rosetta]|uniref:Ras GTPase-activating protein 1-like n=1 Tax=Salpingoeca rosetta (strain ATCC 50818 / BSB-021) TaxID=946362 RepID=F2TWI5_SALR5|nr:uncharacterized protein PTSG_00450 [Salpingoeca rosetta]EGD72431.1 hypothetical protein PTSG_00450 [Salpingoeca rosetta]|eukprot:XP_004999000.1 hypothetical protein PTSG_00450 [Salpingoeca rosetta]